MDKLCRYLDRELEEYENKVANGGKLSRTEIEDGKNIAKFRTALLTNKAMEEEGYSGDWGGTSYEGDNRSIRGISGTRGRNARRSSRGQYSSEGGYSRAEAKEEFIEKVYELIDEAPDEHTRKKAERFANEIK
ncbi:MAG: hypothetical protein IJ071_08440 [Ruminococcus sp.]|nr:hypothetical protein [Ruminococcus sp.]